MNTKLIASAPTIERLIACSVKYWCGSNIRIEGEKVFNNNGQIKDVVVINKKGRFRLERVQND